MGSRAWRRSHRGAVASYLVALLALALSPAAAAQTPDAVRDGLVEPGVYVAADQGDPQALAPPVARARAAGHELVVVVLVDPPRPDADGFALRVRQLGVGDPVLVFAPDGSVGVSSTDVRGSRLLRAREAAQGQGSPPAATAAFTDALLAEPPAAVPELVPEVARAALVALAVLIASAVVEHALRRRRRRRRRASLHAG